MILKSYFEMEVRSLIQIIYLWEILLIEGTTAWKR